MPVKVNRALLVLSLMLMAIIWPQLSLSSQPESQEEEQNARVLQSFVDKERQESDIVAVDDQTKRIVMFVMGVPLLILLITTAVLGIAMGVYGKQVFLPHLICAGLSLTLAIAHAVVGIVWFYPF